MSIAVVKPRDDEVLTKKRNFIARLFRALNMARFYRAICKESEALSRVPSFANTPSCAWLFRRETCILHVSTGSIRHAALSRLYGFLVHRFCGTFVSTLRNGLICPTNFILNFANEIDISGFGKLHCCQIRHNAIID